MRVMAIFDVDEEILEEQGTGFSGEMGWVADSGIYLVDYMTVSEDTDLDYSQALKCEDDD